MRPVKVIENDYRRIQNLNIQQEIQEDVVKKIKQQREKRLVHVLRAGTNTICWNTNQEIKEEIDPDKIFCRK